MDEVLSEVHVHNKFDLIPNDNIVSKSIFGILKISILNSIWRRRRRRADFLLFIYYIFYITSIGFNKTHLSRFM